MNPSVFSFPNKIVFRKTDGNFSFSGDSDKKVSGQVEKYSENAMLFVTVVLQKRHLENVGPRPSLVGCSVF